MISHNGVATEARGTPVPQHKQSAGMGCVMQAMCWQQAWACNYRQDPAGSPCVLSSLTATPPTHTLTHLERALLAVNDRVHGAVGGRSRALRRQQRRALLLAHVRGWQKVHLWFVGRRGRAQVRGHHNARGGAFADCPDTKAAESEQPGRCARRVMGNASYYLLLPAVCQRVWAG
jgi:hypothetical protein